MQCIARFQIRVGTAGHFGSRLKLCEKESHLKSLPVFIMVLAPSLIARASIASSRINTKTSPHRLCGCVEPCLVRSRPLLAASWRRGANTAARCLPSRRAICRALAYRQLAYAELAQPVYRSLPCTWYFKVAHCSDLQLKIRISRSTAGRGARPHAQIFIFFQRDQRLEIDRSMRAGWVVNALTNPPPNELRCVFAEVKGG